MARGDGTGPMGRGPLTGRGMGYCPGAGMGMRAGGRGFFGSRRAGVRGRARGFGRGFSRYYGEEPMEFASNKELLQEEESILKARLNLIKEELNNLDSE